MPVPKLKYFLQCDEVRNDSGKFSALGLFDTIYSLVFPATHRKFYLLLGFVGEEGHFDIELLLRSPDGQTLGTTKGELVLATSDQVGNVVFEFGNLPLPAEGRYTMSLFLDGDFCAEHTFLARPPFSRHKRTPEEIAELLERPETIRSANADIACERCRNVYRYQYHLDPSSPIEPGFLRLPPGEFFLCGKCGNQVPIGQVRQNLENIVGLDRRWLEGSNAHPSEPPADAGNAGGGAAPGNPA